MKHWRFMDYHDAEGKNLIRIWYETQLPAVRAQVLYAINEVEATENLEESEVFNPLKREEHVGIFTLHVEAQVGGKKRQFRPAGFWGLNLRELILVKGCQKSGRVTIPPGVYNDVLDIQLRYYRDGVGTIYAHSF